MPEPHRFGTRSSAPFGEVDRRLVFRKRGAMPFLRGAVGGFFESNGNAEGALAPLEDEVRAAGDKNAAWTDRLHRPTGCFRVRSDGFGFRAPRASDHPKLEVFCQCGPRCLTKHGRLVWTAMLHWVALQLSIIGVLGRATLECLPTIHWLVLVPSWACGSGATAGGSITDQRSEDRRSDPIPRPSVSSFVP